MAIRKTDEKLKTYLRGDVFAKNPVEEIDVG